MGATTIEASFAEPAPLQLTVEGFGGGLTGLSPTVAIRDALSETSYLDFNDLAFKTSGWTTRQAAMTEISDGHYFLTGGFDPWLWTPRPAVPAYFVAEYDVPNVANAHDLIVVTAALPGEEFETTLDTTGADALGWQEVQLNRASREIRRFNLYDSAGARITVAVSAFAGTITRRDLI